MKHQDHPIVSLAAFLLLCASAFGGAQEPDGLNHSSIDPDSLDMANLATSLGEGPAGLEAYGTGYRAFLTQSGVRFEPALGARAAELQYLELATVSLAREYGAEILRTSRPNPRQQEQRAVYEWNPGLEERWQVRPDGVEFSYWLSHRPAGSGDLVARLALRTELPFAGPSQDGGIRFELPDVGGVSIGAALGIDAAGRSAAATVEYRDGHLELRLPADFVDSATYPLVLDPLVGPVVPVASGATPMPPTSSYIRLDVGMGLVVWAQEFSASVSTILTRRIDIWDAAILGTVVALPTPKGAAVRKPRVSRTRSGWSIVVYEQQSGTNRRIMAHVVRGNGLFGEGPITVAASTAGSLLDPDVGSDGRISWSQAPTVVVWRDTAAGEIRFRRLTVSSDGEIELLGHAETLVKDNHFAVHGQPRISAYSSELGRHLVVWRRSSPGIGGGSAIQGRVLGVDGIFKTSTATLASLTDGSVDRPDVDGVDERWVVAWERRPSGQGTGVSVRRVSSFVGKSLLSMSPVVDLTPASMFFHASQPVVAWTPTKSWVAWRQSSPFAGASLRLAGINSQDCTVCEASQQVVALSGVDDVFLGIWTAAGPESYWGMPGKLFWSGGLGGAPMISAQGLSLIGEGGTVVDLGGTCGNGGTASCSSNPSIGNPTFTIEVIGAGYGALSTSVLTLAPVGTLFECGSCLWLLGGTSQTVSLAPFFGLGVVSMPVPCDVSLVGTELYAQWRTPTQGETQCPINPNVSYSNVLRITFGL